MNTITIQEFEKFFPEDIDIVVRRHNRMWVVSVSLPASRITLGDRDLSAAFRKLLVHTGVLPEEVDTSEADRKLTEARTRFPNLSVRLLHDEPHAQLWLLSGGPASGPVHVEVHSSRLQGSLCGEARRLQGLALVLDQAVLTPTPTPTPTTQKDPDAQPTCSI